LNYFKQDIDRLRNASDDLSNFFGMKISYQTIHNWVQATTKNHISNIKADYSGYYCYDEQYVKIKGVWMYSLTLFDHCRNYIGYNIITPINH
jgi:transposase-like protein